MPIAETRSSRFVDKKQVIETLTLLHRGNAFEIRVLFKSGPPHSQYFRDPVEAAEMMKRLRWRDVYGVYSTLNRINPSMEATSRNRLDQPAKTRSLTSADEIIRRTFILVDVDPVRRSNTSSTESELALARVQADEIREWLRFWKCPSPFMAMSGNGYHLLIPIDLPNDHQSKELVEKVLEAIRSLFPGNSVKVDTSVSDAARIVRTYGTTAQKGDNTAERPHRMTRLTDVPEDLLDYQIYSKEDLQSIAQLAPARPTTVSGQEWKHWAEVAPDCSQSQVASAASAYVRKMPEAVEGHHGSSQMMRVCSALHWGFCLSDDEAWPILEEYNERCTPPFEVGQNVAAPNSLERKWEQVKDGKRQRRRLGGLLAKLAPIRGLDPFEETEEESPNSLIDFGFIDSAEFASRKYSSDWLVDHLLKNGQSCIIAGPSKSMKTSISVELGISIAAGIPFFGKASAKKSRVAIVSAESGEETLQETAVRICESKGVDFSHLGDALFWAFRPPQISDCTHIASLAEFIDANQVDVLMIDPAYLTMGIGDEARNQFAVGAVLQNLTMLQNQTGVVPILCAHTNKNIPVGRELSLPDIAYAGFGQWARQWLLINRRVLYTGDPPGHHLVYLTYGGSAGHSGSWAIDISEGDIRDGRYWNYDVRSSAEARRESADEERRTKETAQAEKAESARQKIIRAMAGNGPMPKSEIASRSGLTSYRFRIVFGAMQERDQVITADRTDSLGRQKTGWILQPEI